MTNGVVFLLVMTIEGAVAAILGSLLHRYLNHSRFGASLRTGAAAIIGTGATHPLLWMGFPILLKQAGGWWQGALLGQAAVVLVEALFYAAVLRGHWRWSLVLSICANAASFGAGFLLARWLGKAATGT